MLVDRHRIEVKTEKDLKQKGKTHSIKEVES